MRKREFLSPSSIALFYDDRELFYMKYLAEYRPLGEEQTQAMAIGSAFDAYVKSHLYQVVFNDNNPQFDFETIFESQVIDKHRTWAREHGKYVFDMYKLSGALQDLYVELVNAVDAPRFEFEIKGVVNGTRDGITAKVNEVPLLGKPDVAFKNKHGNKIVLDWKVNGYCSNYPKSPNPGYIRLRKCDGTGSFASQHKDVTIKYLNNTMICASHPMELVDEKWAMQLAIYGWLLGEPVGSEFITCIHQIVAKPSKPKPALRVAEHVNTVTPVFQKLTYMRAAEIWHCLETGHVFFELTREESDSKCAMLEERAKSIAENPMDPLFMELSSATW